MIKLDKDIPEIIMGYGDVRIMALTYNETPYIAFKNDTDGGIGRLENNNKDPLECIGEADIVIRFESIRSMEVLILKLQELRSMKIHNELVDLSSINNITDIYEANSFLKG